MRFIDGLRQEEIRAIQVYLSQSEARALVDELSRLLDHPEAREHFHVGVDQDRDASFSIVTPRKLESDGYTSLEQQVLEGMPCD